MQAYKLVPLEAGVTLIRSKMENNKIHIEGVGEVELVVNLRLKRMRLQITEAGKVRVEVPKLVSMELAQQFIAKNIAWIRDKQKQWTNAKSNAFDHEGFSSKTIYRDGIGQIVLKKNARSTKITLRVAADGEVRVSMPSATKFSQAEGFIDKKLDWIKENLEKNSSEKNKKEIFDENTEFSTRFHTLVIRKIPGRSIKAFVHDKKVNIQYPMTMDVADDQVQEHIRHALTEVMRHEAKQYLPKVLHTWSERLNLPYRKLTIKNNKTNWGSCSSAKNINLNLHLMRLPDHLIDLIVVHELMHTVIMNHGPEFKAAMRKVFPKADAWDLELNKYNTSRWL